MAREDVDLWLILTDPVEARKYIEAFDWNMPKSMAPTEVVLDSGRRIEFNKMSDEEAVIAATAILRDVECAMVMREKQYAPWEH